MKSIDYSEFALMRAELLRDYAPANAQERLLVNEVAAAWRRLDDSRHREELFFDLQRHAESVKTGVSKQELGEGAEVLMWTEKPQRAYDQVLRAIREAQMMFDRAVRRIEDVQDRRLKRERIMRKEAKKTEVVKQPKVQVASTSPHTAGTPDATSLSRVTEPCLAPPPVPPGEPLNL